MKRDHTEESIPVIEGATLRRKGTQMVNGVMEAGMLVDRYIIPRRDFRNKTGYQREASISRVNLLVRDLSSNRVDLPTALLLNLRNFKPGVHLVSREGRSYFSPREEKLYVVDGQHRVEALKRLVESDPERWSDYRISFIAMLGADEREEMEQFYIVNSTAKSVRTDLALDLLKQRAENDPAVMRSLEERAQVWKIKAQTLAERLEELPLWKQRIRFPGLPKEGTTIDSAGMAASFKGLLDTPYFSAITTENQIKILDAYWRSIHQVVPEAFADRKAFTLQKSTGVMTMHTLLVSLLEYVRSKGKSVLEVESFVEPLSQMFLHLQGDTSEGEVASGADFWRAGAEGAAGSFSSNAGRRVLVAKLRGLLPPIEVE